MSERLRKLVQQVLIKEEDAGKKRLAKAVKREPKTLERWLREGIPSDKKAYKLALACGCSEEEALQIAMEHSSEARETA